MYTNQVSPKSKNMMVDNNGDTLVVDQRISVSCTLSCSPTDTSPELLNDVVVVPPCCWWRALIPITAIVGLCCCKLFWRRAYWSCSSFCFLSSSWWRESRTSTSVIQYTFSHFKSSFILLYFCIVLPSFLLRPRPSWLLMLSLLELWLLGWESTIGLLGLLWNWWKEEPEGEGEDEAREADERNEDAVLGGGGGGGWRLFRGETKLSTEDSAYKVGFLS